jgi:hypothetical protein
MLRWSLIVVLAAVVLLVLAAGVLLSPAGIFWTRMRWRRWNRWPTTQRF